LNIPSIAAATGPQKNELILFYTLLELTIIVIAGRVGGALARRCAQAIHHADHHRIVSTIMMPPGLRYFIPRAGLKLHA
jgi:hypothetical protein